MKKNILVIASVCLVLVMTLSMVSAGWFTGAVTKIDDGDEINVYVEDDTEVHVVDSDYIITAVEMNSNNVLLSVNGIEYELASGESKRFGSLDVTVKYIDEVFWRKLVGKDPYRARLIVSRISEEQGNCVDSDGGLNYYVKGSVTGRWPNSTTDEIERDGCCWGCTVDNLPDFPSYSGDILLEGFCGKEGYIDYELITCENGCKDGACIKETSTNSGEVTYAGVLEMLNGCTKDGVEVHIASDSYWDNSDIPTGNSICSRNNKTCVSSLVTLTFDNGNTRGFLWECDKTAFDLTFNQSHRYKFDIYNLNVLCC